MEAVGPPSACVVRGLGLRSGEKPVGPASQGLRELLREGRWSGDSAPGTCSPPCKAPTQVSIPFVHVCLVSSCVMRMWYRALLLAMWLLGGRPSQLLRRNLKLFSGAWQVVGRGARSAYTQTMPLVALRQRRPAALSASVWRAKAGKWYSATCLRTVRSLGSGEQPAVALASGLRASRQALFPGVRALPVPAAVMQQTCVRSTRARCGRRVVPCNLKPRACEPEAVPRLPLHPLVSVSEGTDI